MECSFPFDRVRFSYIYKERKGISSIPNIVYVKSLVGISLMETLFTSDCNTDTIVFLSFGNNNLDSNSLHLLFAQYLPLSFH